MSYDSHVSSKPRVLVLCFDGTANEFDDTNTNVVKFYSLLTKDRAAEQITYYQAGVGTYFDPGVVSPFFNWGAKLLDKAAAWYLNAHVRDGYHFLMQNYREGDKICLFGFSRGAYTARALAGFLHKIGLLPRDNPEQIPFAYKLYKRTDAKSTELSRGFKKTFCRPVTIDFVGVWDTVASVGLLYGRDLPFTNANAGIKVFRHALSLDEHRAKFQPNTYHRPDFTVQSSPGSDLKCTSPVDVPVQDLPSCEKRSKFSTLKTALKSSRFPRKPKLNRIKTDDSASLYDPCNNDVLEAWFAGCHSDVGGGSVEDRVTESLGELSLQWMVRQVLLSECGIIFDSGALQRANIDISSVHNLKAGSKEATSKEAAMEAHVIQPGHDELELCLWWWILEILPLKHTWQDANGKWRSKWKFNLGKGRVIQEGRPHFHVSVKQRMANASLKYNPRARWAHGQEIYVD